MAFWGVEKNSARFGSSLRVGLRIILTLFSPDFHSKLRLLPKCPGPTFNAADKVIADDVAAMELAANFAFSLASNYMWGQQMFSLSLPFAAAGLLAGSY